MSPIRLLFISAATILISLSPPTVRAQYMYLDSNGDGVHTSADVLYGAGPNLVDVFLHTDQNRGGSPATCDTGDGDLTINSWVVNLLASGGTVSYVNYVNRQPANFPGGVPIRTSGTEMTVAQIAFDSFPPGLYHLMQVTITAVTGAPSIGFVELTSIGPDPCSFGSRCSGRMFQNTYELNIDWFDADGLPYSSGGTANSPPVLEQPSNMSVDAGRSATQVARATDPDLQPIALSKSAGPDFMSVVPLASDRGAASVEVHLNPFVNEVGSATGTIRAYDGIDAIERSFDMTVNSGVNQAPLLESPDDVVVVAGTVKRCPLQACDPDGDVPAFARISGPGFVQVTTMASRRGGAAGELILTPGICDLGDFEAVIAVMDGSLSVPRALRVRVLSPQAPPSDSLRAFFVGGHPTEIALGDLNGDGNLDVVLGDWLGSSIHVMLSTGTSLLPAADYHAGSGPQSVAVADFNEDGRLDVAAANSEGGTVHVFPGSGTGALAAGSDFPAAGCDAITVADLNRDGHKDIAGIRGGIVSVLIGRGDGTFQSSRDIAGAGTAYIPPYISVADLDLDGRPDILTPMSWYRGLGDGAFLAQSTIPEHIFGVVADLSGDGIPDLALTDWDGPSFPDGELRILTGTGSGTFEPGPVFTGLDNPQALVATDLDADGDLDLAVCEQGGNVALGRLSAWHFDGGVPSGPTILAREGSIQAFSGDIAAGDLTGDGYPDLVTSDGWNWDESIVVLPNRNGTSLRIAEARAFQPHEQRVVPVVPSSAPLCVRLEPVGRSFEVLDVDPASIQLASKGTGTVEAIAATPDKTAVVGDRDRNGIPEVPVCFAGADIARLFGGVIGRQTLLPRVEGALYGGRRFCASVELTVQGAGRPLVASVIPNPLNPSGTLQFTTSREGRLIVRLYDVHGRLVRSLRDAEAVPAGIQTIPIDGFDSGGLPLASGAYFYRIDAAEGTSQGRLMILK